MPAHSQLPAGSIPLLRGIKRRNLLKQPQVQLLAGLPPAGQTGRLLSQQQQHRTQHMEGGWGAAGA